MRGTTFQWPTIGAHPPERARIVRTLFPILAIAASVPTIALAVPPNVRVHRVAGDLPRTCQHSGSVAALGDHVLAVWFEQDTMPQFASISLDYAYSLDGGATFVDGGTLPAPPDAPWKSDPIVTVNEKTGVFYVFGYVYESGMGSRVGMVSAIFGGGGVSFGTPVFVTDFLDAVIHAGTLGAAADSATGNLHVALNLSPSDIYYARSVDNGATWPPIVSIASTSSETMHRPHVAVGPAGDVLVAWRQSGPGPTGERIRVLKSADGGASFGAPATASAFEWHPISSPGEVPGAPANFDWDHASETNGTRSISLAVDRTLGVHRGRAYVVWQEPFHYLSDPHPSPPVSRFETEPNEGPGEANGANVGDVLRGNTRFLSIDNDWWVFTLAAGERLIVNADSTGINGGLVTVDVFSPEGVSLLRNFHGFAPGGGGQAVTFTAPVAANYYLRLQWTTVFNTTYRLRTAQGIAENEPGRDQYDVVAAYSDDGASWSLPARVNQAGLGFDAKLPEVAVGADGLPYVIWHDYRADFYGARSHVYMGRSADGGATWATEAQLSEASSFWHAVLLQPFGAGLNDGLCSDGRRLHPVWSDARAAHSDVYGATVDTDFEVVECPAANVVASRGRIVELSATASNLNPLFANAYFVELESDRGWPLPTQGPVSVAASDIDAVPFTVQVPDTAAAGLTVITIWIRNATGTKRVACATTLDIRDDLAGVGDGPAVLALAAAPNPAAMRVRFDFALPRAGRASLAIHGADGRLVRLLLDGDRAAGRGSVEWEGRDRQGHLVPPGLYLVRFESAGTSVVRRVAMVR